MRVEPYVDDHHRSIERAARRGAEPKSLPQLLGWFRPRWEAETPTRIHVPGVWRTRTEIDADIPRAEVGGSVLGSPQLAADFRRLIENAACETERDTGAYVRPCRAALFRLGITKPRTAARMGRLARGGWDPMAVAHADGLDYEDAEILIREGLRLWWREYAEAPIPH